MLLGLVHYTTPYNLYIYIYIWVVRLHIPDRTFMAWSPHTPLVLVRTITSSTSSIYHTSSTRLIIHSNTHVVSATTAHHHQRMVRGGTTFREEYSIFLYTYIFIYTLLCILWKKPWYFCPTNSGFFSAIPPSTSSSFLPMGFPNCGILW